MHHRRTPRPCLFALLTTLVVGLPSATAGTPTEEGFTPLFNGSDLAGWREVQGQPGSFHVEEGVIIGERNRQTGSAYWLSTEKQYADFDLRLEFQLSEKGNSGVFLRVPSYQGRTSVVGMEVQLLDDGHEEGKPGKGDTGAIYRVAAANQFVPHPAGTWNRLRIVCEGDRIQVFLNDVRINDVSMADHPELEDRPRKGYLGLSAHTFPVKYRNVRIRVLGEE